MLYGEMPEVAIDGQEAVKGFRFNVPHPPKEAILRLPTAAEMSAYTEAWKKIRGRKKNDDENLAFRPDLDLFNKIRVAGADFDEFESRFAIVKLIDVSLEFCERTEDGAGFEVVLKTPFGETRHHLATPTAKQLFTTVYSGKSGAKLYDQVIGKTEGYAAGFEAPEHHREAAGQAVAAAVGAIYESFDPNR